MKTDNFPSVNFHLLEACNMRCNFCFATFLDLHRERQNQDRAIKIVSALAENGFKKITFAGGEPTLWKGLSELLEISKYHEMTTMVVTNGYSLLDKNYYNKLIPNLDWLILSVDSVDQKVNESSGRAIKKYGALTRSDYEQICFQAKSDGLRLKVNTVVNRYNVNDDMTDFITSVQPERWKIFQALPIDGQNSHNKGTFEVSLLEFNAFIKRHSNSGLADIIVPEDNQSMTGSYVMVSPDGRFFDDTKGYHTYSRNILDVGVKKALQDVSVDFEKFVNRGGIYNW